jgi:hypothetical protein
VINVGFSVAQLIGAAVSQVNMAIAVYMIVLVYSLLMGGFIVPRKGTYITHTLSVAVIEESLHSLFSIFRYPIGYAMGTVYIMVQLWI